MPRASLAGNALTVIIAIMSFLASLTVGAVGVVREAASSWQGQVLREVTIQIASAEGRDMKAAVNKAVEIARSTPGIANAVPYTDADIMRLLEPWLGKNIALDELPAPRLIVVRIEEGKTPDFNALSTRLARDVPGASLDDHRAWLEKLRITGNALSGFGLAILLLVLFATALSVLFATRSAVSGNRDVVEVLHVVGARDGYIARAFGRRFLGLGLRGGLIGGGLAVLLFAFADWSSGAAGQPGSEALLGRIDMSLAGYGAILLVGIFIAVLTTVTSRLTVMAHLRRLD
ncbi:cell division protein FtsX [Terrihabitans soli]|uniref:Cell division protein FtsX n=1 Tax=Terrihabitans soli TaxID=708113 RepID=A0A6S6QEL1_9HYPH|nr:ABC transporter permease [Terrihabitans soli]BCJ89553.1 cell division protein FtsX [Terrihabitans soli]